jgi:hypothetical protein
MSDIVFILGAGCSKSCGAPLMADFLDIARHLYSVNEVGEDKEHFELVFKAIGSLQVVHSKSQLDLNNIESIFNAFEIADTLGKLPEFEANQIGVIINSLKRVIVTTLERTMRFPVIKGYIGTPPAYKIFSELIKYLLTEAYPKHKVAIITFNYDIAVDLALCRSQLGVDYGLEGKLNDGAIPLLKLHGSLNWASKTDDGTIIPLIMPVYLNKYRVTPFDDITYCTVPIGSQLKEYFANESKTKVQTEPFIVPPSWNKAEYSKMLSSVWSQAAKELGEAEHIFILGYSLPDTDAFFKLLFALGTIGAKPINKIEVFNPDNGETIKSRYVSIMGLGAITRFKYQPVDFQSAMPIIQSYFPKKN